MLFSLKAAQMLCISVENQYNMLKNVVPGSPYERKDSNHFFIKFQVESKIKCEEIKKNLKRKQMIKNFSQDTYSRQDAY